MINGLIFWGTKAMNKLSHDNPWLIAGSHWCKGAAAILIIMESRRREVVILEVDLFME